MMGCRWIAISAVMLVALGAVPAAAQAVDPKAEIERGAELARQEKFADAVAVWLGVLDRVQGEDLVAVYKKLGVAFKRMERLPEAWYFLTLYLTSAEQGDTTTVGIRDEVEGQLGKTHVPVKITCTPADVRLRLPASYPGGRAIDAVCPAEWWFLPGKHTVHAERSGYQERDEVITVVAGSGTASKQVVLAAVVPPPGDGDGGETIAKPGPVEEPSRVAEWALIGSGLALGATGGVFYWLAYSKNEDLHDEYKDPPAGTTEQEAKEGYDAAYEDEVEPKQTAAYVCAGVGAALVVAGLVTWAVSEPGGESGASAAFSISPLALPGGTGATMTLAW